MQTSVTGMAEGPDSANRAEDHQQNRPSFAHAQIVYTRHRTFLIADALRLDEYKRSYSCVLACGITKQITSPQSAGVRYQRFSPLIDLACLSEGCKLTIFRINPDWPLPARLF